MITTIPERPADAARAMLARMAEPTDSGGAARELDAIAMLTLAGYRVTKARTTTKAEKADVTDAKRSGRQHGRCGEHVKVASLDGMVLCIAKPGTGDDGEPIPTAWTDRDLVIAFARELAESAAEHNRLDHARRDAWMAAAPDATEPTPLDPVFRPGMLLVSADPARHARLNHAFVRAERRVLRRTESRAAAWQAQALVNRLAAAMRAIRNVPVQS